MSMTLRRSSELAAAATAAIRSRTSSSSLRLIGIAVVLVIIAPVVMPGGGARCAFGHEAPVALPGRKSIRCVTCDAVAGE